MATVYETLRDRIESNLNSIAKIGTVFDYPAQEFKDAEYPVAIIYPSPDSTVEYETTSDDERYYNFIIDLFYQIKPEGIQNAMAALFDLVDDVLYNFSTDRHFENGTPISMPAGNIFLIVEPVKTSWGHVVDKDLIIASIELKCRVSVQSSG